MQKRKETIAKAERSIDEFYEQYNAKKERQIKENKCVHVLCWHFLSSSFFPSISILHRLNVFLFYRESEAGYLASLTDSLSAGTTWSRICDFIELENSQSKTLARTGTGTIDLSR